MTEGSDRRFAGRIGTTIREKWHVDAFLSAGSMAAVYAATHRNGMRGALKILHKHLSRDPNLKKRFFREAYLANKVNHPGALKVLDDDTTEDGSAFLVMELLDGETLETRRQRMGQLPLLEALDVGCQLLDVLASAHEVGVVHRDLKPDNVLFLRNGTIKVLDFGLAQVWDGAKSSEMTETGTILGSPSYMPPEQARGSRGEVGARSDLWAAGATLFALITGETVHVADSAHAKLLASASRPARPIRDASAEVPRAVASVIDRALMFDSSERWPDAASMREALRWALMGLGGGRNLRQSFAPPPRDSSEETATGFDVNVVAERARQIADDSGNTTLRRPPSVEDEDTAKELPPDPAAASQVDGGPSEPAWSGRRAGMGATQRMPEQPVRASAPPSLGIAVAPPRRPRLLGFLLGAAAVLATAGIAASFLWRGAHVPRNDETPAAALTTSSTTSGNGTPAMPASGVAVSNADPFAPLSVELDTAVVPSSRVPPADVPVAPAPRRPRRPRPAPSAAIDDASTAPPIPELDAALPNFPIPPFDPSPTPTPTPSPNSLSASRPEFGVPPTLTPILTPVPAPTPGAPQK